MTLKESLKNIMDNYPEKSVSEAVFTVLQNEIVSFRIAPGTPMVVSHLAEELGVSMTPVREAIQELQSVALVEIGAGRKAYVHTYDEEEYKTTQVYREMLETLGAVLACERATDEEIQQLCQQVQDNIHIYETLKFNMALHAMLIEKDLQFHRNMVHASKNKLLIDKYEALFPQFNFARQFFSPLNFLQYEYPILHTLIAEALKVRNPGLMRKAMEFHFYAVNGANRSDKPIF